MTPTLGDGESSRTTRSSGEYRLERAVAVTGEAAPLRPARPAVQLRGMGKLDDIRRQREQQFVEQQSAPPVRAAKKTAVVAEVVTTAGRTGAAQSRRAVDEGEAKCAVCGKLRPLSNGLVADHQKGLGKFCAGSRKKPA